MGGGGGRGPGRCARVSEAEAGIAFVRHCARLGAAVAVRNELHASRRAYQTVWGTRRPSVPAGPTS